MSGSQGSSSIMPNCLVIALITRGDQYGYFSVLVNIQRVNKCVHEFIHKNNFKIYFIIKGYPFKFQTYNSAVNRNDRCIVFSTSTSTVQAKQDFGKHIDL